MTILSWAATLFNAVALAAFVAALISMRQLNATKRPKVTVFSRTGTVIEVAELQPPDELHPQ